MGNAGTLFMPLIICSGFHKHSVPHTFCKCSATSRMSVKKTVFFGFHRGPALPLRYQCNVYQCVQKQLKCVG